MTKKKSASSALTRPLLVRFSAAEYAWIRRAAYESAHSCAGWLRMAALHELAARLDGLRPKDVAKWKADAEMTPASKAGDS